MSPNMNTPLITLKRDFYNMKAFFSAKEVLKLMLIKPSLFVQIFYQIDFLIK